MHRVIREVLCQLESASVAGDPWTADPRSRNTLERSTENANSKFSFQVFAEIVSSPWICAQYCSFPSFEAYVCVSEPFIGLTLQRLVKSQRHGLSSDKVRTLLVQLGLAIQHIHWQGFVHRLIKVRPILIGAISSVELCRRIQLN